MCEYQDIIILCEVLLLIGFVWIQWSFWHFGSNVLFAGCEDGSIYMWKIPTGDCKIYSGSTVKCEGAVLLPDGESESCRSNQSGA